MVWPAVAQTGRHYSSCCRTVVLVRSGSIVRDTLSSWLFWQLRWCRGMVVLPCHHPRHQQRLQQEQHRQQVERRQQVQQQAGRHHEQQQQGTRWPRQQQEVAWRVYWRRAVPGQVAAAQLRRV